MHTGYETQSTLCFTVYLSLFNNIQFLNISSKWDILVLKLGETVVGCEAWYGAMLKTSFNGVCYDDLMMCLPYVYLRQYEQGKLTSNPVYVEVPSMTNFEVAVIS